MASFLYQIGIFLYGIIARIVALFNTKAKLFVNGRKDIWKRLNETYPKENVVWFHAASLGEFEQGKPVFELLKTRKPEINLLVTFYSPSGYEERKDYAQADVFYLPLDTVRNAQKFVKIVNPKMAVFIRYEFWINYFDALHQNNVPTAVIAAQFRKDQFQLSFWGSFIKRRIKKLDLISVQYESAKSVLLEHRFDASKIQVCGDSRFDRVLATASNAEEIVELQNFKGNSPLIILGSCYEAEEKFAFDAFEKYPEWKFVYAPHHVDTKNINQLIDRLPGKAVTFTNYQEGPERILVLDTIGKLASAYRYGDLAIIGGGFRDGIHNILEPAAFGLPLFFGPNHKSFPEAQALLDANLAFEIDKNIATKKDMFKLMDNQAERENHKKQLKQFVEDHAGATQCITKNLEKLLS